MPQDSTFTGLNPYRFATSTFLPAMCLLFAGVPLRAQTVTPSEASLCEWATADVRWLGGQITPNRVVPAPEPSRRRLLLSYDVSPEKSPWGFHRSTTYDNALAALAFLIAGDSDRAAFTLHALARLTRSDGSLWFGYNTANDWPGETSHESALVRVGAMSWAGYAFAFYLAHSPPCAPSDRGCSRERAIFQETAVRQANYLLSLQVDDPTDPRFGLLRLGYGTIDLAYRPATHDVVEVYQDEPAKGISIENNIGAWFFLRKLGDLTGKGRWREAAERIRQGLLRASWNDARGQFNRGFRYDAALDTTPALDCASWGALFLLAAGEPEKARRALAAVETYAARDGAAVGYLPYADIPVYENPEVNRFFFPDGPGKTWRELPLVWSEGTLGVALAYLRLGQAGRARQTAMGLQPLQVENGGLRYASREVLFQMSDAPSVGASTWLLFVAKALAGNSLAEQIWR